MRKPVLAVTAIAVILGGCQTLADAVAPRGTSSAKEKSDRDQCARVGEASRKDPRMAAFVEEGVGSQTVGMVLGGGLIGLATAAVQQETMRENWRKAWVTRNTWECLQKKGYTLPNQSG
ncbi:MAG: hypothetical protein RL291_39 [Pseudomonadota bacterium]|jgi:hypothetical protein